MAGVTSAMPTSFKGEVLTATHNFTITTGNVFKMALFKVGVAGTYGAASTNYSNITGNSDEASGTGYVAGGFAWTAAQNITPLTSGTGAYTQWSVDASWTAASFSAIGAMIYNSSQSNKAVGVYSFGGTQTVTSGTFTVVQPANGVGTSMIQIN